MGGRFAAIVVVMTAAVCGCEQLNKPAAGSDVNGDGHVDFRDSNVAKPLTPYEANHDTRDFDQRMQDTMERQEPDYRERVREGKLTGY